MRRIIDIARRVVARKQFALIKHAYVDFDGDRYYEVFGGVDPVQEADDAQEAQSGITTKRKPKGFVLLDMQTANAITVVHDAMQGPGQAKFSKIPLFRLVDFCWSHVR